MQLFTEPRFTLMVHDPDDFAAVVEGVRAIRSELGLPWDGYDVVIEAAGSESGRIGNLNPQSGLKKK